MKISELEPTNYDKVYKITDFEHFFDITEDARGNYVYNLNSTVYLNIDDMPIYDTTYPMQWSLVSYKIYQTTRLAWLLMKVNGVKATNMFETLPAGTKVKYVPITTTQSILNDLM